MTGITQPIYVAALGACTAVGRDAPSSAAAVRAGISGFLEHPYMVDRAGQPMRAAIASWLDIALQGQERFEALLFPAIDEALTPLEPENAGGTRLALALGLPASRPGLPSSLGDAMRASISRRYPGRFVAQAVLPVGHASALLGLYNAIRKMKDRAFDGCVVAGVESYLAPETLEWLEENEQLHGAGPLNNAWGFIPGEGAGAVLVLTESALARLRIEPFAQILSVGRGFEHNQIKTQTVCVGEGLTAAFREGLAGLPVGAKVTDVYCDVNGEPYRADEFGFACLRSKEHFESASDFVAPADCWGDVSAAGGPLWCILAAMASKKAYSRGPHAFLWASSESGERGAALLSLPVREE
jgi:3-oxoacyl-[acyl-carrier-protein] synthase-1